MLEDVLIGYVFRLMLILLIGEMIRKFVLGDIIDISGVFLLRLSVGYLGNLSFVSIIYLYVMLVILYKLKIISLDVILEVLERLYKFREILDIYMYLVKFIVFEIYGYVDIKKVFLLLLCGGVMRIF